MAKHLEIRWRDGDMSHWTFSDDHTVVVHSTGVVRVTAPEDIKPRQSLHVPAGVYVSVHVSDAPDAEEGS